MRKYTRIFILMLLVAAALALSAWADEGAVVSVSSAQTEAGDTVTLELTLDNNPGVAAVSVYLDYDAAKLRPLSYEISREANRRFMISLANEFAGSVMMVALKDVDYSGVIAELSFEVLADAAGDAQVSVSSVQLCNFNDEVVDCRSEGGVVSIENDGAAASESGTETPATPDDSAAPETDESTANRDDGAQNSPAANSTTAQTEPEAAVIEDDSAWVQDSVARFEAEWGSAVETSESTAQESGETASETAPSAPTAQPDEQPAEKERGSLLLLPILALVLLVLAAGVLALWMLLRKKEKAARH